jgi:hypothetical protein
MRTAPFIIIASITMTLTELADQLLAGTTSQLPYENTPGSFAMVLLAIRGSTTEKLKTSCFRHRHLDFSRLWLSKRLKSNTKLNCQELV